MNNTEKTRASAQAALEAYRLHEGLDRSNGDETDLGDLLVDLAHLADTFTGEDETSGAYVLERALDVYHEEHEDPDEDPDSTVNDKYQRVAVDGVVVAESRHVDGTPS
jgi:hypothetical protein